MQEWEKDREEPEPAESKEPADEDAKQVQVTWDEYEKSELQKIRKLKEELAKLQSGQPA
jgi:hypothetical protein